MKPNLLPSARGKPEFEAGRVRLDWPRWSDRLRRPPLTLRPACSGDLDTLDILYEACMRPYASAFYTWDPTVFRDEFEPDQVEVLEVGRRLAGFVKTVPFPDHLYLAELQIAAPFRKRQLGSLLLRRTVEQARINALPVRLRVLRNNPAKRLYLRHGFKEVAGRPYDIVMQRDLPT